MKIKLLLILIIIIGAFLRFYKLDWGQGLFTHPDEYHLVISASQLQFPNQMNPHFFSYGTFTIYLIYFTKLLLAAMLPSHCTLSTGICNLFLIGRFYSALFSTLSILAIYLIGKKFLPVPYALVAALLTALTPGLIQQAHFATPESNLIFFIVLSLYFLIQFCQIQSLRHLIISAILLGIATSIKVSALEILPAYLLTIILTKHSPKLLITGLTTLTIFTLIPLILINPYLFLDFPHFYSSFQYESSLAAGKIAVFYTRQFINTTPIIFQLEKILPFALGTPLLTFGLVGLTLMTTDQIKKFNKIVAIILISFLSIFAFNSYLFAKWTRFLSPTFPFFSIFTAFLLYRFSSSKIPKPSSLILTSLFLILVSLWALAFFSIYIKDDVRITADKWLKTNVPLTSTFLVEGGNTIDLPFGPYRHISVDFYSLEDDPIARQKIAEGLTEADYFLVESRRVFMNHQRLADQFPKTALFYNKLFSHKLGFEEIRSFTSFPTINILGKNTEFQDEEAEETWSVFDHPVIRVFKKVRSLDPDEYATIFEK